MRRPGKVEMRKLMLLYCAIMAACAGDVAKSENPTSTCDCVDSKGACAQCCACSHDATPVQGGRSLQSLPIEAETCSSTNKCNGPPYSEGPNDAGVFVGCQNLVRDYGLPMNCCTRQTNCPNCKPDWAASWLRCNQSLDKAPCVGTCTVASDSTYWRDAQACKQSNVVKTIQCLINLTKTTVGSHAVCENAASCMLVMLKKWYPAGSCKKLCNVTHSWIECTINGANYSFDGNNGIFYACGDCGT